jgi:two-component system sensor histidine kinase QseC
MRFSIRRALLINLLLAVAMILFLTGLAVYYLGSREVAQLIDRGLVQTNLTFQAFLTDTKAPKEFALIQKNFSTLQNREDELLVKYTGKHRFEYNNLNSLPPQYQVWDTHQHLLFHSPGAPLAAFSKGTPGFSDITIEKTHWRVLTEYDPSTKLYYIVGTRYALQTWLQESVARDDLFIMVLIFPILGILIWAILARGFNSLENVANELGHRAPNYLEPVDLKRVPAEIAGLVDELNKLLFRLKQALEREQRFASDAAHELRTPLAAIRTQAQVALRNSDSPEISSALEKVIKGVERSTHVVQQLLTLSRIVPGATMITNQATVDFVKIAREIIAELALSAVEKNIELSLENNQEHINIVSNGITLGILLRNLVDNAIRYTPENGHIEIGINDNKKDIMLSVIDDGPGIPPKLRARVFERFFRVLGTKAAGSGLGLAIVQQIASLHHAQVKLGSPANGKGLQIDVIFPKEK